MSAPTDGGPPREPSPDSSLSSVSRRSFLKGAGGLAATSTLASEVQAGAQESDGVPALRGKTKLELNVNGENRPVEVEPRTTLLNALRNHAEPALTGTKIVCDRGTCGACTVILDGQPVYACMTLAVEAAGREVRTVEGLAQDGLSPVQAAFCTEDALMCGFCTPGFLMSVTACLEKNPEASEAEVRAACAGNLCRCGTYPHIFKAALSAGRAMVNQSKGGR